MNLLAADTHLLKAVKHFFIRFNNWQNKPRKLIQQLSALRLWRHCRAILVTVFLSMQMHREPLCDATTHANIATEHNAKRRFFSGNLAPNISHFFDTFEEQVFLFMGHCCLKWPTLLQLKQRLSCLLLTNKAQNIFLPEFVVAVYKFIYFSCHKICGKCHKRIPAAVPVCTGVQLLTSLNNLKNMANTNHRVVALTLFFKCWCAFATYK